MANWKDVNFFVLASAAKSLALTILASFLLVLPLFFEPEVKSGSVMEYRKLNMSHGMLVRFLRLLFLYVLKLFLYLLCSLKFEVALH